MINDKDMKKIREYQIQILDYFVDICKKNNITYFLGYGSALGAIRHKGYIPWDDDIDIVLKPNEFIKFQTIMEHINNKKYFYQTIKTEKYWHVFFDKIRMNNTCMIEKKMSFVKTHKGIAIDIFPLVPYPDNLKDRKKFVIQKKIMKFLLGRDLKVDTFSLKTKIAIVLIKIIPREVTNKKATKILNQLLTYDGKYTNYYDISDECYYPVKAFDDYKEMPFENKKYNVCKGYNEYLRGLYGNYMKLPPVEERTGHGEMILSFNKNYEDMINEK